MKSKTQEIIMDDIVTLSDLLQSTPAVENEVDPRDRTQREILTPASFGLSEFKASSHHKDDDAKREKSYTHKSHDNIWTEDDTEINDDLQENVSSNTKNEPMYEIYFKQIVGTEDIFFGTDKTPLTSDCTLIVVKVHFPGCKLSQLELDVFPTRLQVESSKE